MTDFWEGKKPCWVILDCNPLVRDRCPAYTSPHRPCWEIGETYCRQVLSFDWDCKDCKVFRLYEIAKMSKTPSPKD